MLNANLPNDTDLLSSHAAYIRETREEVNDVSGAIAGQVAGVETISMITAETLDAGSQMLQVQFIDTDGTISYISGGTDGQLFTIKIKAGRSVTISHSGAKTNGDINLDGVGNDLAAEEYDTLQLVNIGGNPSLGILGYWAELSRALWA